MKINCKEFLWQLWIHLRWYKKNVCVCFSAALSNLVARMLLVFMFHIGSGYDFVHEILWIVIICSVAPNNLANEFERTKRPRVNKVFFVHITNEFGLFGLGFRLNVSHITQGTPCHTPAKEREFISQTIQRVVQSDMCLCQPYCIRHRHTEIHHSQAIYCSQFWGLWPKTYTMNIT